MIIFNNAKFTLSAATLKQLPPDEGIEVAFVGRSNAGKSSALNALTRHKNLARTSKTPGRTQLINIFTLNDTCRLVDLPGYGYAKVAHSVKEQWQATLARYLEERKSLAGLVLLMDIRHPLKDMDMHIIEWGVQAGLLIYILLTKADKLSYGAAKQVQISTSKQLERYQPQVSCQLFSATSQLGLPEFEAQLMDWYENPLGRQGGQES